MDEVGLGEVLLEAGDLVCREASLSAPARMRTLEKLTMNVVVVRVVAEQVLNRIPRECEPAVVIDRLCRRNSKEEDTLAHRHERARVGDGGSERVENEAFEGVVVEGSEGVGDVEAVVNAVNVSVQEGVGVEVAVPEVLPCVENEAGRKNLGGQRSRSLPPSSWLGLTRQRRTGRSVLPTSTPS